MPLPGSHRDKKFIQEVAEPKTSSAEFLQEIKTPEHEEVIVEEKPKRKRSKKK